MPTFNAETARWWVENPEEGARRAAEAWLRLWALSKALKAYRTGDRRSMWALFGEHPPDPTARGMFGSKVRDHAPGGSDLYPSAVLAFIEHHRLRLARAHQSEHAPAREAEVRRGLSLRALEADLLRLAREGESREKVLLDSIRHVVARSGPASPPTGDLVREVARLVREEARGRDQTRHGEVTELAGFAERDKLLKRGRDAGLPPREYELYKFFISNPGATNPQAARTLGVSVGTVKSLRHRIKNTPGIAFGVA